MIENTRAHRLRRARLVIWAGAAALLLSAGGALTLRAYLAPQAPQATSVGEADIRSEFSLIDHTGRAVTEADFAGRWQLVFFGFTHCPDICPTTLAYMGSVLDLLGPEAERVAPLFITVDPARDTVPVMAEYVSAFHPRLVGLTGTEAQVADAAQAFRTWYERVEEETAPGGYMMAHAGHIYLMDPDGRFEAVFQERDQPPEVVAEEILMQIEKEERQG
ncbi:SCO family protein [Roseitranquillus sediminis]|uniref:SCO family protein n=1 Tax=Roseitranquillus sediminis TaxID=2809051 RepID=UPI001D0CD05D|nr:SCO family protein [Roseitranquillus sediminis]MBM9595021.1 SCO family protein [Roseitranquillus sediminis]